MAIDAQDHRQPRPGDQAPDFELPDQDGEPVPKVSPKTHDEQVLQILGDL